jgi:hypothetical protein
MIGKQVPGTVVALKWNGPMLFRVQVQAQFAELKRTAWCKPKHVHKVVEESPDA